MAEIIKNIEEIRNLFPNEWVLIGNPVMDQSELNVVAGIPVLHSKDKRELGYLGKTRVKDYETITLVYTGVIEPARTLTGIFNSTRNDV